LIQKVFQHRKHQDAYDDCHCKNASRRSLSRHSKRKIHELFDTQSSGSLTGLQTK
jgi:hypothetical protein